MNAPSIKRGVLSTAVISAALLIPLSAWSQSQATNTTAEATIFENELTNNGGSYNEICAGNLDSTGTTRRGFIRYALPDVPEGATVDRVTVSFTQERVRRMGTGAPKTAMIQLNRVNGSWMEGSGGSAREACGGGTDMMGLDWGNAPGTQAQASAAMMAPSSTNVQVVLDSDNIGNDSLIADVEAWLANPSANNGWMVSVAQEDTVDNARLLNPGTMTVYWTEEEEEPSFKINAGLNDAWFNAETAGQGFLFTVFPDIERFFLAWFTFDTERPDETVTATLGAPGQRWVTAFGDWIGNTVILDVELTRGGVFDSPEPAVEQQPMYGTIGIEFRNCNSARLVYDFPDLGLQDEIELTRIANDNVALCETLSEME